MTKAERDVYQRAKELFDGCAICGNPDVQMHHIRYGGEYGRKTYDGNVIPLCYIHHNLAHSNKKKYMAVLIDLYERKAKNEQI